MNWSVGNKIAAGFSLALAVLVVIGTISYLSTSRLIEASDRRQHSYLTVQQLSDVLTLLIDAQRGERGYVITGDEQFLQPYTAAVSAIAPELREIRKMTMDNPNHQRRLDELEPLIGHELEALKNTIALRRAQGLDAAVQEVRTGNAKKLMDEIRKVIGGMQNEENALLQERAQAARQSGQSAQLVIVYGTLVAFVLMAVAGWLITRNISGPIRQICRAAEQLAAGHVAVDVFASNRSDEVGALSRAFSRMTESLQHMAGVAQQIAAGDLRVNVEPRSENDVLGIAFASMIENLRRMTRELSEGISVLASSASEIMASMGQVSSGSAQTAAAVSETTATVEEVKQTIQVSTEKAGNVSQTAQQTTQVSHSGRRAVENSIDAIHRIHDHMTSIAESIVRLSEQGQAIGEIIATVNDLAEQSNLLAVNAAIEAAKAGEQGKGFAVVAQEVKNLAEQSRQATAQVRSILGDIQKATSGAVMATEQGSKAVETGVRLSGEAGESIRVVAESIETAARAAAQIAASAQQQSVGMDQVALAMQNINQASAQNVASTEQTQTAAKNLHDLGRKLKDLVERYRT